MKGCSGAVSPVPRVRGGAARAVEGVLEALSPTRCVICERQGALLCPACLARLPLIDPVHACTGCGAPFGDVLCTECRGARLGTGRCLATAVYEGPAARLIKTYKDAGERRLAPLIAQMLLDTARHAAHAAPARYGDLLAEADALTFVPVTARAFLRRGFDHMEAVARELGELCGLPVVDALAKHGSSDQRALGREGRARDARDAYEVVAPVAGLRLVLLDDCITTGATIAAAGAALARAGAARVDALALARVW